MEQNFSELIEYLDGKFNENKERIDALEEKFDILQTSVDIYAKKADTYFQEMVALSHRVDRHEKWFQQVAQKLEIKLEY